VRTYEVHGLEKGPRKLRATVRLEHSGKLHVDTLDLYSARARTQLCRDLCRVFEQDPVTIEADLTRLLTFCERADEHVAKADAASAPAVELSAADRAAATAFGRDPDLVERVLADFETCGLVGERTNKLLCYLALTSRKMAEPLCVLILSSSGAGKTALQDAALAFCPPEDLVKLTSLSGKALFYKERTSLKHKVLALEEGAGAEDAAYAIRNLISAECLTTESAMRDPATGKLTTMQNTVEGPTAVFCTTTDPQVDAETKSRFLVTGVDESRAQTRRILQFQRARAELSGLDTVAQADDVIARQRNFQRLLQPLHVVNPHAHELLYDDDRLQSRRLQPRYLGLIAAAAFLRQFQKEVKTDHGRRYIQVDHRDIELARELAVEILGRTLDELSIPARNLLQMTHDMVRRRFDREHTDRPGARPCDVTFTRKDLREHTGWTQTRLRNHLKELLELEYLVLDSGGNGRSLQRYRLLYDGEGADGQPFIPGVKP
jgi:hypothetical protein